MIRTLWVGVAVAAATLLFGGIAIGAAVLRLRGGVYSWASREWARSILWASGVAVVMTGGEHLRRGEGHVLISNHVSWYDVFVLAAVVPIPFYFIAKKELERIPFFGWAWKAAGHISVDRSDRERAIRSLREAGERIRREKGTVIVFPEGTRSPTGRLQPFKKGAFALAVEASVPVVPAAVVGSYEVMRPGSWVVRPRPIEVRIGAPIYPAAEDAGGAASLAQRAHARVSALLEGGETLVAE